MISALLKLYPEHKYSLYPSFGDFFFDAQMPLTNPYKGKKLTYGPRHLQKSSASTFWNKQDLETLLKNPDIIHSNNFWSPTQLIKSKLIYTCYDLGFTLQPDWTTEENRIGCFNGVFTASLVADWIVAISKASKSDYLNIFPHFPEDRIRVVYPCSRFYDVNLEGICPLKLNPNLKSKFWLSVGTIEPRKNQFRLIEAYAKYLKLGGVPYPLVFAGGKGWLMEGFERKIRDLGIDSNVILAGYTSDEELIWLYRNCFANLYPSFFEGFGLPVLEGMQFGAVTLTSKTSSLPEVAGNSALLLNPYDVDEWANEMLKLSINDSQRMFLKAASIAQAEKFNWKNSASQLIELYDEAHTMPKRIYKI
jgi:glycosyltransferase involved in cell wall biosynthesis